MHNAEENGRNRDGKAVAIGPQKAQDNPAEGKFLHQSRQEGGTQNRHAHAKPAGGVLYRGLAGNQAEGAEGASHYLGGVIPQHTHAKADGYERDKEPRADLFQPHDVAHPSMADLDRQDEGQRKTEGRQDNLFRPEEAGFIQKVYIAAVDDGNHAGKQAQ